MNSFHIPIANICRPILILPIILHVPSGHFFSRFFLHICVLFFFPVCALCLVSLMLDYCKEQSPLEKWTIFQPIKKFPTFYGTWRFIITYTSTCQLSLSWSSSIQSIPPHPTSWRSILILSSHLCLGLSHTCNFITLIIAEAVPNALFPILLLLLWLNALSVFSNAVSGTDCTCVWQITV
jgi:hypothetical protein